jgi:hypothetical protein
MDNGPTGTMTVRLRGEENDDDDDDDDNDEEEEGKAAENDGERE